MKPCLPNRLSQSVVGGRKVDGVIIQSLPLSASAYVHIYVCVCGWCRCRCFLWVVAWSVCMNGCGGACEGARIVFVDLPLLRISHLLVFKLRSTGRASRSSSKSSFISLRRLRSASLCDTLSSGDREYGVSPLCPFSPPG